MATTLETTVATTMETVMQPVGLQWAAVWLQ